MDEAALRAEVERLRAEVARLEAERAPRAAAGHEPGLERIGVDALFGVYPDLLFLFDADGTYLDYRAGRPGDLYVAPESFLGRRLADVLPADLARRVADTIARSHATGTLARMEYEIEVAGERKVFEGRAAPLPDGRSTFLAAEVTDRVRAAEALRASEERYRRIVETTLEGVWVIDAEARTTFVNPRMAEMLGLTPGQMNGRPMGDFMDDAAREEARRNEARRRTGVSEVHEFRLRHRDGHDVWTRMSTNPLFDASGAYAGALAMVTDDTGRRATEQAAREQAELLRTVLDHIPVMVSYFEPGGRMRYVNREWERTLGWTLDEVQGHPEILREFEPDDAERARLMTLLVQAPGGWVDHRTHLRDGRVLATAWAAIPLSEGGLITIGQDLSARRHIEEEYREAQRLESIGRLAGGVAHDFNNMLTAVLGYVDVLGERLRRDPAALADLDHVRRAGERARDLTRQLLAIARRQVIAPVAADPDALVRETVELLRHVLGEHVRIELRLEPGVGPVRVDPAQFHQVLLNLAVNARDAMPDGGTLTLGTAGVTMAGEEAARLALPEGRYVRIDVADTGEGMEREVLEHVFEPFFTTKPRGRGTGLGLATVYGIVRQSGGHVAVSSEPGRGTLFHVWLPCADEPVEAEAAARPARTGPARRGGTVLVAEDEAAVRALVARTLREAGHHVLEAADGREALERAAGHDGRLDLVVTDIVMPGMNGRMLAERLRARHPGVRVLYVSGYPEDEVTRHGRLEPGAGFLGKPFTPGALLEAVRRALDAP